MGWGVAGVRAAIFVFVAMQCLHVQWAYARIPDSLLQIQPCQKQLQGPTPRVLEAAKFRVPLAVSRTVV